jgi:hypothetical protein
MIWKGVATHAPSKNTLVVEVFPGRAEVEYPKVSTMPRSEKTLSIVAAVSVEPFKACRWIAHNNKLISDICKV